jgi:bifunctional ADP-heptose synthase (sugar kinase/adenylyltransferase)
MRKVLVVGDVILDKYTHGTKLGVSNETPTIVAELSKKEKFVGGAGLVVRHLLRLGCEVFLLTALGEGESLETELVESSDPPTKEEMNRLKYVPMLLPGWKMPVKHRFFVDDYKLLQYDVLNRGVWPKDKREDFFYNFKAFSNIADSILLCDNRHGVFDEALVRCMLEHTAVNDLETFVDVQVSQRGSNHHWYAGCSYMLMNEKELRAAMLGDKPGIISAGDMMQELTFRLATSIILKMGAQGSSALVNGTWIRNHAPHVAAVDTCGAGDAFLAALVASEKGRLEDRLQDANNWAARSTTYKGTIVPGV